LRRKVEGTNILKVEYREGKDIEWTEKDLEIEVETKQVDLRIADLDSTPTKLVPDLEDAELKVTIKNIGEKKAEAVTTHLILPRGFNASESYSDIASIGTIDSLSTQTATYYIDLDEDLKPGDYTAKIEAEYLEEDEYKNTTLPLRIPVKSTPILRVTASHTDPEILTTSERNVQLTIIVQNKGSKKAERVRVKAREKTEQPFEFENGKSYDYIGDLEPGETGEAVLKFKIKPKKAVVKTYHLDLELRALEDSNIHTFNQDVKITIAKEKKSTPLPIALGGFLLVGIYLTWRYLQKYKK